MGSTVDLIQCNPCWERNTCFFSISISQCAFINCRGRGSYCGDLVHILIQSILGICIHLFECVLHFSKTNLLPVLFMLKIICRERRVLFFHFVPIRLTCLFFGLNYFDFNCQKKKKANIKDPLLLWFWWKGFEELVGMWTNNIKEQNVKVMVGFSLTILSTMTSVTTKVINLNYHLTPLPSYLPPLKIILSVQFIS